MNDIVLEPDSELGVADEELISNPEELRARDQFAHLLLTAWTAILKEEQDLDELHGIERSRGARQGGKSNA